jgi:SAM-dependent methyltransferase
MLTRTGPSAFLVKSIENVTPGRALDVAMGRGRNALHLAKIGWDVTGFDISAEGLAVARAAARCAGVKLRTVLQGWEDFDFGTGKWDLIVMIYAWVPINDFSLMKRIVAGMCPSGLLVFEHHLGASSVPGSPMPNQLPWLFGNDLRILRCDAVEHNSDLRSQRPSRVAHLLAQR